MTDDFLDGIISEFEPKQPVAPATSAEKFMGFLRHNGGNRYELVCWYIRDMTAFLDNLAKHRGLVLHTAIALSAATEPAPRTTILRAVIKSALVANHLAMLHASSDELNAVVDLFLEQPEIKRILVQK